MLAAIRLGLFQLLFLGGVADHAAVNDSVQLAKRTSHGGAGLVNAVLRRAAREGRAILDELDDHDRRAGGGAVLGSRVAGPALVGGARRRPGPGAARGP